MQENFIIILSVFFALSFWFSIAINSLLLKFVKSLGIRNKNEMVIRWSPSSKPALGGITFFIIFLFSFTSFAIFQHYEAGSLNIQNLGLLLAVCSGFLLGLFDDAYNTRPWLKFFSQVFCGVILVASGIQIELFDTDWLNMIITLIWVVGIMNSINLLDNMDGITTVVSIGILMGMLGLILFDNNLSHPMLIIILGSLASLFGFLFFNWNPSKMYMGDTGSQFLGILLASLGIMFFWNGDCINVEKDITLQLTVVGLSFSLPIIDTTTVFLKRIFRGTSPFIGGKDHTTHHLSYLGLSDRQVAIIYSLISLFTILMIWKITTFTTSPGTSGLALSWAYFLALFLTLFVIACKTREKPFKS